MIGAVFGSLFGLALVIVVILLIVGRCIKGPNKGSQIEKRLDDKVVVITGKFRGRNVNEEWY